MSTLIWICVLCWAVTCRALDLHLSTDNPPGTVTLNGSLDTVGWIYTLGNIPKDLLSLDAFSGVIYVSGKPRCNDITTNPIHTHLKATKVDTDHRYQNVVQIPLNIFVHGENCKISPLKNNRKGRLKTLNVKTNCKISRTNSHLILTKLNTNFGICVEKNTPVLTLKSFIPAKFHSCIVQFYLKTQELFHLDAWTGTLQSAVSFCFQLPHHVLRGSYKINGKCNFTGSNLGVADVQPFILKLYTESNIRDYDYTSKKLSLKIGELIIPSANNPTILSQHHRRKRVKRSTNQPPRFSSRLYIKSVPEEQSSGYTIDTITATDPDTGPDGTLRYSIKATSDGRSQNMFTINEVSGEKIMAALVLLIKVF